jgi:hypothetical protein
MYNHFRNMLILSSFVVLKCVYMWVCDSVWVPVRVDLLHKHAKMLHMN